MHRASGPSSPRSSHATRAWCDDGDDDDDDGGDDDGDHDDKDRDDRYCRDHDGDDEYGDKYLPPTQIKELIMHDYKQTKPSRHRGGKPHPLPRKSHTRHNYLIDGENGWHN